MNNKLEQYAKDKGLEAAKAAVEKYKEKNPNFDLAWEKPMHYASGFTARHLTSSISREWLSPLKRQARIAGIAAVVTLIFQVVALFYAWSLVSFASFLQFLVAFSPAVAALLFTISKAYKAWAEARKYLAEAKIIESSASNDKSQQA